MQFDKISLKLGDAKAPNTSVPWFDYTKLSAINTCPRWGLIRYFLNGGMAMPSSARAMPLEMGGAAHQAFAVIRWFQLWEHGQDIYSADDGPWLSIMFTQMLKMYGQERTDKVEAIFKSEEDARQRVIAAAQYITETSGFYDDPSDRRRTLSNLNDSLLGYIDRTDLERCIPVVRADTGLVGIEVPYSVEVSIRESIDVYSIDHHIFNFHGKIDGLMYDRADQKVIVEENKTASRMDASWQDAWATNHQPTGYCVVGGLLLGSDEPLDEAYICGMAVPLPKNYDLGGVARISVPRNSFRFRQWENWLLTTYEMYQRYINDPLSAPEYTHSCNRYFRSCSFIPLCNADSREEQEDVLRDMVVNVWDPLAEEA